MCVLNYVPCPSCLTCLCSLRADVIYELISLTFLRTFVHLPLTCTLFLAYALFFGIPHMSFLRVYHFVRTCLTCLHFFTYLTVFHFLNLYVSSFFLRALCVFIFKVLYLPSFFTCFTCLHFLRTVKF